jgi:anti-anti-sigma regulatory factor
MKHRKRGEKPGPRHFTRRLDLSTVDHVDCSGVGITMMCCGKAKKLGRGGLAVSPGMSKEFSRP